MNTIEAFLIAFAVIFIIWVVYFFAERYMQKFNSQNPDTTAEGVKKGKVRRKVTPKVSSTEINPLQARDLSDDSGACSKGLEQTTSANEESIVPHTFASTTDSSTSNQEEKSEPCVHVASDSSLPENNSGEVKK